MTGCDFFKNAAFLLVLIVSIVSGERVQFRVIKQWRYLNFTWPDESTLNHAVANGVYVPENIVIAGINFYK